MRVRLLLALILANILLVAPGSLRPEAPVQGWIAVEAFILVGLFAVIHRRPWSVILAAVLSILTVGLSVLAWGDTTARESLARPLNLYLDLHLLGSVRSLVAGTVGPVVGALLLPAALMAGLVLATLLSVLLLPPRETGPGLEGWSREQRRRAGFRGMVVTRVVGGVLLAVAAVALTLEPSPFPARLFDQPGIRVAREQTAQYRRMMQEQDRFAGQMAAAPSSYEDVPDLLGRLRGRDVVLAFVESYGMSALDDPRYAPVVRARVEELGARVVGAGLWMATGTLVAPTQGGQSWFAHGSLLSGLWLDNQLRYDLMLTSGRETLVDDFRRAGHRTVALMPAITLAWPEGERFRYDRIFAFADIDYAGPPLNWVTMPDQFTWSYLQRAILEDNDPRPVFAELGLISSHAPWTPILPVLDDWESIGDGEVFERWADAGERPVDLWRDHDRVREHYALSVDYAVHAMAAYAERYVDDQTLLIVMGDHQPAPMITGEEAGRSVPVHVISADPDLVAPFLSWGFVPGALPDPKAPERGMDAFRDWFVHAYSGAAPGREPVLEPTPIAGLDP